MLEVARISPGLRPTAPPGRLAGWGRRPGL